MKAVWTVKNVLEVGPLNNFKCQKQLLHIRLWDCYFSVNLNDLIFINLANSLFLKGKSIHFSEISIV